MPFTIDLAACKKQMFYDPSKPQEKVPEVLPENWMGTGSRGLPVREIPMWAFPCVLYMWPNRPTTTVVHRNAQHEIVHEEEVPTEHLTKAVSCAAHKDGGPKDCSNCNKALDAALAAGWRKEAYIPETPAKPDDDLYGPRSKK